MKAHSQNSQRKIADYRQFLISAKFRNHIFAIDTHISTKRKEKQCLRRHIYIKIAKIFNQPQHTKKGKKQLSLFFQYFIQKRRDEYHKHQIPQKPQGDVYRHICRRNSGHHAIISPIARQEAFNIEAQIISAIQHKEKKKRIPHQVGNKKTLLAILEFFQPLTFIPGTKAYKKYKARYKEIDGNTLPMQERTNKSLRKIENRIAHLTRVGRCHIKNVNGNNHYSQRETQQVKRL